MRNATLFFIILCFLGSVQLTAMEVDEDRGFPSLLERIKLSERVGAALENALLAREMREFYKVLGEEVTEEGIKAQIAEANEKEAISAVMNQEQLYIPVVRKGRAKYWNTANQTKQQEKNTQAAQSASNDCKLCPQIQNPRKDAENYVVERKGDAIVFLNRFPYKVLQLLFLCKSHTKHYADLTAQEQCDVDELQQQWVRRIQSVCGFNDYVCFSNEGHACTGGTLPDHWHRHLYPRYDSSRAIERPLADYLMQAQQTSLYGEFLQLRDTDVSGKLQKVYGLYGNVLKNAKMRASSKKKSACTECTMCTVMKDKEHSVHKYVLADTPDFTIYFNPEGSFLGEVMFVFKEHVASRGTLQEASSQAFRKYLSKIQTILPDTIGMDGFSCSESTRGGHSVFVIRPRKVPNISTGVLETGEAIISADPDQIYKDVKAQLEN